MSRITDNEAIRAARVLEEYCDSKHECSECRFFIGGDCGIWDPYDWKIPTLPSTESQDSKRLREREEFFKD